MHDRNEQPDRTQLTANDARFEQILRRLEKDPDYRVYVQVFFTVTHAPYHNLFDDAEFATFRARFPEVVGSVTQSDLDEYFPIYDEHRFGLQWNFEETVRALGLSREKIHRLAQVLEVSYALSVHKLDRWFGRVVDKIEARGLMDEALIALTTDHGEILYRENAIFQWTHGKQLVPEVLRIPLILRSPGLPSGNYDGLSRSIDLHPTLLGLSGIAANATVDGQDLGPALLGSEDPPSLRVLCHTSLLTTVQHQKVPGAALRNHLFPGADPQTLWVLIREGPLAFKLRRTPAGAWEVAAYDWENDAGETKNLFDAGNPMHVRMADDLAEYKQLLIAGYERQGSEGDIPEDEMLERLRALGYVR